MTTPTTHAEWQAAAARLRFRDQLWIDGKPAPAADGRRFPSVNPANGRILAEVARGAAADIDRAVAAARRAFDNMAVGAAAPLPTARRFCCALPR